MNAHVRLLGDGGAQCWSHKSSLSAELRAQTRRQQQQNIRRRGLHSCKLGSEVKAEIKVHKEKTQAGLSHSAGWTGLSSNGVERKDDGDVV